MPPGTSMGGGYLQPALASSTFDDRMRMAAAVGGFGQDQYQNAQPFQVLPPYQRGPANNIRDSLNGMPRGRRDSPEPGSRPGSRDASPKGGPPPRREGPPLYRGDSPLRLLRTSGAGRAPSLGAAPRGPGQGPGPAAPSGAAPSPASAGFCLGGLRPSSAPPGVGIPGGMGAFRAGGPVRAKTDLLGSSADRSRRPGPAPAHHGGGSRPGSLGPPPPRAGSQSRPPSPQARPSSPGVQARMSSSPPHYPPSAYAPCANPVPNSYPIKQRTSLSSHMRRAPSPTPAFNRNPSPNQPRWRS